MLIFLHGDDTYRSRAKLRELREKFLREVDPSGANLAVLDGATVDASEIWGAMAAQSFLVRKRMVVVEQLGAAKSDAARDEVETFLEKIPEDVIAVFWEGKSYAVSAKRAAAPPKKKPSKKKASGSGTAKRHGVFALLLAAEHAQEFAPLRGAELLAWAQAYARDAGTQLVPPAARALCEIVGSDLWRLTREMDRLAMVARSLGDGAITPEIVRAHVAAEPVEDIFAFVDALGRADARAAATELAALLARGADPQYLATMIARQLRLLVMAADMLERGMSPAAATAALGENPYVAQKVVAQARNHSCERLRALYPKLLELDHALKSSRAPREALVELFCLDATGVTA